MLLRMADVPDAVPDALARRIVVVVPARNEEDVIADCLRSILDGNPGVKVMLLDGQSTDRTAEIAGRLAEDHSLLSVHDNPRRVQAAAVNIAAEEADADRDILIRCDAHALYPPRFAFDLAAKLMETGADSVVVPMDAATRPGASAFERALALVVDTPLGSGGSAHRGGHRSGYVDHGHHAAFWRARFQGLDGYDEAMLANQDAEYDTRLRADGGTVWLEAKIRLTYFVRRTPLALWRQYWRYGRGRADHIRKHLVEPRLRQVIPVMHAIALVSSLAILPTTRSLALLYPLVYLAAICGAGVWFAVKRRRFDALLCPLVLAILHTSWGFGFLREWLFPMRRHPKP